MNAELKNAKKELGEKMSEIDGMKEKLSKLESENADLKENGGGDLKKEVESLREKTDELAAKNAELSKEVKSLKKTNASLDKQLKEMLEDGQLTL